ncbi:ChrR family anti-sigma-E factor [Litorivita sp. NS0012-18]|uniref:ChrR family anti-sigma-E factor n=1 Tax=Litorivita sp. NS0012-18 TaxID=3127655 RepID=UPI003109017E
MTDQIKHHLDDALLMGYAAGSLPEAFNLVIAAHVSMCDECRARAQSFDALGGAVLEGNAQSAMAQGSLAATLARIKSGAPTAQAEAAKPADPARKSANALPAPVQDYIGGDLDAVKWRPLGMGVKQAILPTSKEASVRLLYIPAGAAMPDHGHRGTELTLVLKGAFRDEEDRFAAGDIEIADETDTHTPIADIGEDCICLAATDAPLRFNGFLPRLLQPFFKI